MKPITPLYEVRYTWIENGEYCGTRRAHTPFPSLELARAHADRINEAHARGTKEDATFIMSLQPYLDYLLGEATVWRVYHREEKVG